MIQERQAKGLSIILLLFSPLIGLFSGLKYLSWDNKKVLIVLFFIIYGSLMQYGEEADAAVYMEMLDLYEGMSLSTFLLWLKHIIELDPLAGSPNDVYVHFLSFIISSILGVKFLFFPVVAGIYGYFYANALSKILVWDKNKKIALSVLFIILLFIIHRSVTSFQTVRTWTGMWIMFNGVLGYAQTKERKYILLILATPLIHFAYFIIALPVLLSLFAKRIPTIFMIGLYFSSFFITLSGSITEKLAGESSLADKKIHSYYRQNQYGEAIDPIMERREKESSVWYTRYGKTDAVYYGGHAFALFIIIGGFFRSKMTNAEAVIFTAGLFLATFANFASFSYAFYSRTMGNAVIYILAAACMMAIRGGYDYSKLNPRFINLLKWICILIFVPKIVYFIADFLIRTSIFVLGLPFIGWFADSLNVSIREFIGQFL